MLREEYSIKHFDSIDLFYEEIPNNLIDGINQSPFQFKNWQELLYKEFVLQKRKGRYIGSILFKESIPIVGGHFVVKKNGNRKGVFFLASISGETDYNDLIYFTNSISNEEITYFINNILKYTNQNTITLDRVLEKSILNGWAIKSNCNLISKTICAEIFVKENYDLYWSSLKKSIRQNIRTAKNRLKKDNMSYEIVIFDSKTMSTNEAECLRKIYEKRRMIKNRSTSLKYKILETIRRIRKKKFNISLYAMLNIENLYCAYIKINEEIAGYFLGLKGSNKKVSIMQVAFDDKFKKYSPCMILISDVLEDIHSKKLISIFDLASGDEKYKFSLGAVEHNTINYIYENREMYRFE